MKMYLYDKVFLKELDYHREKDTYVRIISLTNDEYPREEIIGRVTGGSVNVDGASAIRRSCSLSMVALENDTILTDDYWCYNNKFKLELGLKNLINKNYPDIIWFDMGIYIITDFSKSKALNNLSISLSGKDKMCRLNGEVSGNIMMSTDFGTEEIVNKVIKTNPETGETTTSYPVTIKKLPLYTIIQNAVKTYGQEKTENIIINDLDQYGYELWEYRGDEPMYLLIPEDSESVTNITFNGETEVIVVGEDDNKVFIKDFGNDNDYQYYSFNTLDKDYNNKATTVNFGGISHYVAKIEYGHTAGYHRIDLVYNNDLILNAGETVTSLLDKLKAMLGDFEYFYDLQGHFVFQKKKIYTQELFSPIDGTIITPTIYASQYSYKFEDEALFTAISNPPNVSNLKNDFAIWGTRKSISGENLPIHVRYAIDKKPIEYILPYNRYTKDNSLWYIVATSKGDIVSEETFDKCEDTLYKLIGEDYVPANDFEENTIYYTISKSERYLKDSNIYSYKEEKYVLIDTTKYYYKNDYNQYVVIDENATLPFYEIYDKEYAGYNYTIEDYDWRELIYQMAIDYYKHNQESDFLFKIESNNPEFIGGYTGYEQYYSDMQAFWRYLYNPLINDNDKLFQEVQKIDYYDSTGSDGNGNDAYWNKQIHIDPNTLNFWIDFLDTEGELGNYSVKKYDAEKQIYITNVGTRSKVINESSINSIYFRETPEILYFIVPEETMSNDNMSYKPIQIQDSMKSLFYRSAQGASAISKANELIYQHTANIDRISITSIPIYYLEPNTRIYVAGYGDYSLDKITYSLTYNGTMSLTGNKIIQQFY